MKGFLHYDTCEHPGATGYVGLELTRLLYSHPSVHIAHLVSHSQAGQTMGSVYPA